MNNLNNEISFFDNEPPYDYAEGYIEGQFLNHYLIRRKWYNKHIDAHTKMVKILNILL